MLKIVIGQCHILSYAYRFEMLCVIKKLREKFITYITTV